MKTDTPRTDEQIWTTEYHHELCDVVDMQFARQLELELAASKAEVERLKATLKTFATSMNIGEEVMSKAEAEIYRLKDKLKRAVEIQDEMCTGCRCYYCDDLRMELSALK
jgi:predicted adenine nucleotide alpha hydrolase (AANH) superfamily ATPase